MSKRKAPVKKAPAKKAPAKKAPPKHKWPILKTLVLCVVTFDPNTGKLTLEQVQQPEQL